MEKRFNFMVPRRELTFVLPYLGKISLNLRESLRGNYRKRFTML